MANEKAGPAVVVSFLIAGIASAAAAFSYAEFLPIGEAAELTNIGVLLAFVVVCIAVVVLRYKQPDLPRTFRCPGMPVVPLGLVVYLAYGRRRSRLAQRQEG